MCVCMSANHPYLQPEGWITKGAAPQDRPNAFERRLWLPPNGPEWSWSTAAKPDVFDLGKGQMISMLAKYVTTVLGPVAQKPISANPRLKVNQRVYLSTPRCCSTRLIFGKLYIRRKQF